MTHLKSSCVYYLDHKEVRKYQDVVVKACSSEELRCNSLFMAALSPFLKSVLANKDDFDNITTIVTDFSASELQTMIDFFNEGRLPLPFDELSKEIPAKTSQLFSAFGVDLAHILFGKTSIVKTETKWEAEELIAAILKEEDEVKSEGLSSDDTDNEHENSSEGSEKPMLSKKRKRRATFQSQLMSKYTNYLQIQDKYKDYLRVTIPNIGEPDTLAFCDYTPVQSLGTYWKPPRPPSRKKKTPKGYEKYPLKCSLCPKRFTNDILRAFHMKVYHNSHYQCPYCPNAYHQDEALKFKKHLFNHEHVTKTTFPHECIQCGKEDFCLQRLQKHIDNFRGPFHNNQCTQCHQTFKCHRDYKEHVTHDHSGVWKYRCDDCELVFDSIQAAKEHRLEAHKRKQPPKHTVPTMCDICGKVLKGSSIPNHMKIVHMTEMPDTPCPHCGKVVKELQRHIKRSHEKLTCDLCGKLVPPGHMLRHNDQYHTAPEERRYKCEVCSKGFSTKQRLTDHVHTHTGEKPYTCQYCGKGFANSSGCRLHVRFTHLGQKRLRKK